MRFAGLVSPISRVSTCDRRLHIGTRTSCGIEGGRQQDGGIVYTLMTDVEVSNYSDSGYPFYLIRSQILSLSTSTKSPPGRARLVVIMPCQEDG